jgi:hypothetical protein
MVQTAMDSNRISIEREAAGQGNHESLTMATVRSDAIVQGLTNGKVATEGMPLWLGEFMATVMTQLSPKGLSFARYSIDYHIVRNYLYMVSLRGEERARIATPHYALQIVDHYLSSNNALHQLLSSIAKATNTAK